MSRKSKSMVAPKTAAATESQLPRKPDPKVVEAIVEKTKAQSLDRLALLTKVASRRRKRRFRALRRRRWVGVRPCLVGQGWIPANWSRRQSDLQHRWIPPNWECIAKTMQRIVDLLSKLTASPSPTRSAGDAIGDPLPSRDRRVN